MTTRQIAVSRWSVRSSKSYEDVLAGVRDAIGHPNMKEFSEGIARSSSYEDVEKIVEGAVGKSGFIEFARFDLGAVLAKKDGAGARKILHLVVGNPLIMQAMVRHVPDAGSYAPVTLLIDERPDGVHLSYDEMASLLAPYGNAEALHVARDLDLKIAKLVAEVAGDDR